MATTFQERMSLALADGQVSPNRDESGGNADNEQVGELLVCAAMIEKMTDVAMTSDGDA